MPNWCATTYRFHGTKEELEVLNNKIKEWTSASFIKTDFGDPWLGNILVGSGLKDRIDNPDKNLNLRCRGTLIGIEDLNCDSHGDYTFDLWTETAWSPMPKMWLAVIEALGLNVEFSFYAEECGDEIYWVCDPHGYGDFKENEIYIDSSGDRETEDICGYYTMEDAIDVLNKFFGTSYEEIDPFYELAEDYIEENGDDILFSIHAIDFDNDISHAE